MGIEFSLPLFPTFRVPEPLAPFLEDEEITDSESEPEETNVENQRDGKVPKGGGEEYQEAIMETGDDDDDVDSEDPEGGEAADKSARTVVSSGPDHVRYSDGAFYFRIADPETGKLVSSYYDNGRGHVFSANYAEGFHYHDNKRQGFRKIWFEAKEKPKEGDEEHDPETGEKESKSESESGRSVVTRGPFCVHYDDGAVSYKNVDPETEKVASNYFDNGRGHIFYVDYVTGRKYHENKNQGTKKVWYKKS